VTLFRTAAAFALGITATASTVLVSIAPAASHTKEAPPLVTERQHAMEDMKNAMKILVPMAKEEIPYEAGRAAEAAAVIHGVSTRIADFYPAESGYYPPGHALPSVWEEPEAFRESADEALKAASALMDVLPEAEMGGDITSAVMEVAESCRSCHDDFKKDD
jgi:cytochrome c556